jgi:hypothetical protein
MLAAEVDSLVTFRVPELVPSAMALPQQQSRGTTRTIPAATLTCPDEPSAGQDRLNLRAMR